MHPTHELFLKKLKNFEHSFNKVLIPQRIQQIRSRDSSVKMFCRATAASSPNTNATDTGSSQITYASDSVSIRIVSQNLLVSDEIPNVQWLFRNANLIEISRHKEGIVTELWFRCWKLKPSGNVLPGRKFSIQQKKS